MKMLIAVLFATVILGIELTAAAGAEQPFSPQCNGFGLRLGASVVVTPAVLYRTPGTIVEVWYHNPLGTPLSEIGWALIATTTREGETKDWPTYNGTPGTHALAMQVYDQGMLMDGWLKNPDCLRLIELSE